jgi:hypothetical protein
MTAPTKPQIIVEPFALNAPAGNITSPIPVPSQTTVARNNASFNDGFPPATFLSTEAGGLPPNGADFNGIFFMITAYLAYFQSGQVLQYDPAVSTAFGGYPNGALLGKANGVGFWVSTVAANVTDPDTGGAGWQSLVANPTGQVVDVPAAGANNNFANPGATIGFLDLNPTAACNITGIVAGFDGQELTLTNVSAFNVTINAMNVGSAAANQIRLPVDMILSQNSSISIRYVGALSLWTLV